MLELSSKARARLVCAGIFCLVTTVRPAECLARETPSDEPHPGRAVTVAPQSTTHMSPEMTLRASISDDVADAWKTANFSRLDATADEYIRSRAKTYSGKWRLAIFYGALSDQLQITWPAEWNLPGSGPCRCDTPNPMFYREADRRWDAINARVRGWVKLAPRSPHAKLALALMLANRAWFYRGTGYSDGVPPVAWPLVSRYLEESRTILMQYRAVRSADPQWFDIMLFIASAQSWSQPQVEALAQDLREYGQSYASAYQVAAVQMLPKWGGSYEQVERFAQQAITANGDDGVEIYARIYWNLGADVFAQTRGDWATLKRGFESMIRKYPDPHNLNGMAMFACAAGDQLTFTRTIARLGPDITPDSWTISLDDCRSRYGKHDRAVATRHDGAVAK
jgi:hypothetical protein